jgi:putative flippase GtrA
MTPPLSPKPGPADATRRAERTKIVPGHARRSPSAPGPLASFARFVLCGGGVGLACCPAVTLLALLMPWGLANALVTIASTLLCTELHARFTFGTGRRAGWRQHWQSMGSATAAYTVTSVATLVLHTLQLSSGVLWEQVVYLGASGLAGVGRFLVLRCFVFATGRKRTPARTVNRAEVAESGDTVASFDPVPPRPQGVPSATGTVNGTARSGTHPRPASPPRGTPSRRRAGGGCVDAPTRHSPGATTATPLVCAG